MGLVESVRTCIAKTFVWRGRAGRSEYWWFQLACVVVVIAAELLVSTRSVVAQIAGVLIVLFFVLADIAVLVRRLHDTG